MQNQTPTADRCGMVMLSVWLTFYEVELKHIVLFLPGSLLFLPALPWVDQYLPITRCFHCVPSHMVQWSILRCYGTLWEGLNWEAGWGSGDSCGSSFHRSWAIAASWCSMQTYKCLCHGLPKCAAGVFLKRPQRQEMGTAEHRWLDRTLSSETDILEGLL